MSKVREVSLSRASESLMCCAPLGTATPLSLSEADELASRLKALADPVRLRLVALMLDRPAQEACTCELSGEVSLTDPTVNHHLKKLTDAGLLTKERRGMNVYYRVVPEALSAIARVLIVAH